MSAASMEAPSRRGRTLKGLLASLLVAGGAAIGSIAAPTVASANTKPAYLGEGTVKNLDSAYGGTPISETVLYPTTTQLGGASLTSTDLLLLVIMRGEASPTPPPAGWSPASGATGCEIETNHINQSMAFCAYYRFYTGSTHVTVTTGVLETNGWSAAVLAFSGVTTLYPLDTPSIFVKSGSGVYLTAFTPSGFITHSVDDLAVSLVMTAMTPTVGSIQIPSLTSGSTHTFTSPVYTQAYRTGTSPLPRHTDLSAGLALRTITSPSTVTFPTWRTATALHWAGISLALKGVTTLPATKPKVTIAPNPVDLTYGGEQSTTFAVTVTAIPGHGYPIGTVSFETGTTALGVSELLTSTHANTTTTEHVSLSSEFELSPGSHQITATFTPAASTSSSKSGYSFSASTATAAFDVETVKTPTVTVAPQELPQGSETTATFTVTVTGTSGHGYPEGSITLVTGATTEPVVCTASSTHTGTPKTHSTAFTCHLNAATELSLGSHGTIHATFTPTSTGSSQPFYSYLAATSASAVTFDVVQETTPTVTVPATALTYGSEASETFTVTVTGTAAHGYPKGTVTLATGTTAELVACTASSTHSGTPKTHSTTYTCHLSSAGELTVGTYTDVTATFTPTPTLSSSTPNYAYRDATSTPGVTFTVSEAETTPTITVPVTNLTYGSEASETFTVAVTGTATHGYPKGTVTITTGTTTEPTACPTTTHTNSDTSTFICSLTSTTELTVATYTDVEATFTPTGTQSSSTTNYSYESVTSTAGVTFSVAPGPATPTITLPPASLTYGSEASTTFTVTVTGTAAHGYPKGTVTIATGTTTEPVVCATSSTHAGTPKTHSTTYTCHLSSAGELGAGTYADVMATFTPTPTQSSSTPNYAYRSVTSTPGVTFRVTPASVTTTTTVTLSTGASSESVADGLETLHHFEVTVTGTTPTHGYQTGGTVTLRTASGTTVGTCTLQATSSTDIVIYTCILTSTIELPASSTPYTLHAYDSGGTSTNGDYTYAASTSLTSSSTVAISVSPANVRSSSTLYITNFGNGLLDAFPTSAHGNVTPQATARRSAPVGEALDRAGDLWVADVGADDVVEYTSSSLASGLFSVKATITSTALSGPSGLAFDATGDLWVANETSRSVVEFTHTTLAGGGNLTAKVVLSTNHTFDFSSGIAFDGSGNLWVANLGGTPPVVEISHGDLGVTGAPAATVTLTSPSLDGPVTPAFDAAGDLWVTNYTDSSLVEFTPAALSTGGAVPPEVTIGADAGNSLDGPRGLAFDAAGGLWVTNYTGESAVRFTPTELAVSGNPTPVSTIGGATTGFTKPWGLAIWSAPVAPPEEAPGAPDLTTAAPGTGLVHLDWTAPTTPGSSAVTNYEICYAATAAALATCGTHETAGTATSFTVTGLADGTTYDFAVKAENAAGYGAPSNTLTATPSSGPAGTRVAGSTADATAAAELSRAFPSTKGMCPSSGAVVLATTQEYDDALASQFLAQSLTTGTLLTPTESLSPVTAAALKDEGVKTVYVVGGPLAITTTVVKAVENLTAYGCGGTAPTGKVKVVRIFGQTKYATAAAIAEHVGTAAALSFPGAYSTPGAGTGRYDDTSGKGTSAPSGAVRTAFLVNGTEFQDAQAASVASYRTRLPLLLTKATTLSTTVVSAIESLGIRQVILMGGTVAITSTVEAELVAKTGVSVLRVAGKDFADTAVELARFEVAPSTRGLGWTPAHRVLVARGNGFTDGIAGAVLESPRNTRTGGPDSARPLLLTESPTTVGTYLATFLKKTGHTGIDGLATKTITALSVLGGPLALSTASISAMDTDLAH